MCTINSQLACILDRTILLSLFLCSQRNVGELELAFANYSLRPRINEHLIF